MIPVYTLAVALAQDPARVAKTQSLTLDSAKPHMGLKGRHDLFASDAWWDSIKAGRLQTHTVTGSIERTYFADQGSRRGDQVNSFILRLADGSTCWKRPFLRGKAIMKCKGNAKIMKVIKSNANDAVTSYERE